MFRSWPPRHSRMLATAATRARPRATIWRACMKLRSEPMRLAWFLLPLALGCAGSPKGESTAVPVSTSGETVHAVPFEYFQHLLVVPVRINDAIEEKFILDTGGGANTISATLCKQIGCKPTGEIVGKRMLGQEIRFPRATM